jgi:hypothetical protein
MNLKHIKDVILENLRDISRGLHWFLMLILVFIGATTCTLISVIVSYRIVLFLFGSSFEVLNP